MAALSASERLPSASSVQSVLWMRSPTMPGTWILAVLGIPEKMFMRICRGHRGTLKKTPKGMVI